MTHPFLEALARGLAERGVASLRYQFPFMEQNSRRPDPPSIAHTAVQAAVDQASRVWPSLPLFAGGRSFGGRMTSQAQALSPLPGVVGLAFLAFPLHPAGRVDDERGKHLFDVQVPMLFLQGTRDALADLGLLESLTEQLGKRATLSLLQNANHSFCVPARFGRTNAEVRAAILERLVTWMRLNLGRLDHADLLPK